MVSKLATSIRRTRRFSMEQLEARMVLHGGHLHATLPDTDAPTIVAQQDVDGDGHLGLGELESLSPMLRSVLDPHEVGDLLGTAPIDFDKVLGLPSGGGAAEAVVLPDFFPQLDSAISVDQTSQPGRTLLRFGTQVNNQGAGPAILISGRPGVDTIPSGAPITSWVNADGSQNVLQAVYNYTAGTPGSFTLSHYLAGGRFTYHASHGHFHFDGYAYYRLRHSAAGQAGAYVQRSDGTGVVGEKTGFCLINTSSSFTQENGQSSTSIPGYNATQTSTSCGLIQGVHVGKADEYSAGLSGQWLDVTGVPNGQYFLEIELDGNHAIAESNDANNAKSWAYTLNVNPPPGGISPDVFDTTSNNNTFALATDMGVLGTFAQTGLTIHWGQDRDYFKFVASSSGSYAISLTPANGDVNLFLFNDAETQIGASTNSSGNETITYNFQAGKTYAVMAEAYNSSTSSNYQIAWNLKPAASSSTGVGRASESGGIGTFLIARNGPTTSPLTVNFSLTGTATNGVDYQLVQNSITIGNLASMAEIQIRPILDNLAEGTETVMLTITSSGAYVVGQTNSIVTIRDPKIRPTLGISPETEFFVAQKSPFRDLPDLRRGIRKSSSVTDTEDVQARAFELLFGQ